MNMSRPVFNSLGSNYWLTYALVALEQLISADESALAELKQVLEKKYQGDAYFFYKGRDAIEFVLASCHVGKDDVVMTQAFSCFAIEEAIERVGAEPVFVDVEKDTLNLSVKTLDAALKKNPHAKIKAVIIQHVLGQPADTIAISRWCNQHQILLIEDLAQSISAKNKDGSEVGKYGDVIIFSFGRDKVVDAVAGGAAVFKQKNTFADELYERMSKRIAPTIIIRDMLYPVLTWTIRKTHRILIGKVLFQILKKLRVLTSPIESPTTEMMKMPPHYAALALLQWHTLIGRQNHRQKIARIYKNLLPQKQHSAVEESANLRYPFFTKNPDELTRNLLSSHIYLTDRWYRKPIDFGSLGLHTRYHADDCPNAESLAATILNLPTHRGISEQDAKRIVAAIQKES